MLRLGSDNAATVTLEAVPGQRYSGHVVEIGASALPQVGTQAVVQRPNPQAGAPDQPADVAGVFVVKDGVAMFAPVVTGILGGLSIEVDGVAEGTEIVSGPVQSLREMKDRSRVRAKAAATR